MKEIEIPFHPEEIRSLRIGDMIHLTGTIYTARDAAHKMMIELLNNQMPLPFNITNQLLYYCGPSPAKPNHVIGSAGPTTSSRMDIFTEDLLKQGLKGMLGKGVRNGFVKDLLIQYQAVYLVAIGGTAALLSKKIKRAEIVAFPELGAEAIFKLQIEQFPSIVAYDCFGGDLFQTEIQKYKHILRKT